MIKKMSKWLSVLYENIREYKTVEVAAVYKGMWSALRHPLPPQSSVIVYTKSNLGCQLVTWNYRRTVVLHHRHLRWPAPALARHAHPNQPS